ncbi:thioesterase family protein [Rutstroemia sp. NJR-2017a WRK4]|nr:thioesterase family protein [Rutstroemia sp. NJR-2017a WRK4]
MAPPPSSNTNFSEGTKVEQLTSHTYSAYFPDPHPIALHLEFLRRTQSGPALFTVQDTKLGRQSSILHITLTQDSRSEVVGYITHSNTATETGPSTPYRYTPHPAPLPASLPLLRENRDPNYAVREMPFASFRKASTKAVLAFPRHGQPSPTISDEWIKLSTGERWTDVGLGYVCDMYPLPSEFQETTTASDKAAVIPTAKYWFPTLLLNIDFKKSLPEEGVEWLFVRVERKQVKNGRMDIELVVWDEGGDLVAVSNHVAYVVGAERNLKERDAANRSKAGASKI